MFQVFERMFQVFERTFQVFERKILPGEDEKRLWEERTFSPERKKKTPPKQENLDLFG